MQLCVSICESTLNSSRPAQHVFLAFTNPVEGREADFNAWYESAHLPELLRYGKGFAGGRRYHLEAVGGAAPIRPWNYLALYVLENDDPASLSKGWIVEGAPKLTPFTGLLHDDHAGWIYTPCTPRFTNAARNPGSPPLSAAFLSLDWSLAWDPGKATELENSILDSANCEAATAFVLADIQRGKQLDSPWKGLVIRELAARDDCIPTACDATWRFRGLRDFLSRDNVIRPENH
jgi:hypothetical protein